MNNLEYYYNYLIDVVGVSEDCINCITSINGFNLETLQDVLYYFAGYHTFSQFENGDEDEEE